MKNWRNDLAKLKLVLANLYFSPAIIAGVVLVLLPPAEETWRTEYRIFYYAFLGIAVASFLLSYWLNGQVMSPETLEMRMKGVGFSGVWGAFRTGMIMSAFLADFCGTLAIVAYVLSRDVTHLLAIFAVWAVHLAAGQVWFRRSNEMVEKLSRLNDSQTSVDKAA